MLRVTLSIFCAAFFWAHLNLASAQNANAPQTPLMGSEATPLSADSVLEEREALRILVVGDGLAGGLGAGMTRVMQDQAGVEIHSRFNESSGLSRREFYDWPAALSKILTAKPVDAVVVLVGVNDRQEIRRGNIRYAFKSPDWVKGYEANVDALIDVVKSADAKLYWISVPPMANASFDADMLYLNALHRQRVAAKQQNYIDVRSFFVGADGNFVDRGLDDTGVERKLRESDGVKFMKVGNNRFGQVVLSAIKALENDVAPVVVSAPQVVEAPKPQPEQGVEIVSAPPSFGQTGLDGETVAFRADSLKAPVPSAISVAQRTSGKVNAVVPSLQINAQPGSEAEKLLNEGVSAAAPVGRFDDFSVPAAP
jgi:uncharacterized protein